ncbi:MAG: IS1182 family transposase, partial [Planctomycetes bacterium]|nr:IS1182 family transposase [Planctomycetota bacterium]
MAYRYGNRNQMALLPKSIEEYVSTEDPVRAYDEIIKTLILEELGIEITFHKIGNDEYEPKTILK